MPQSTELLRDVGRILTRSHDLDETLANIVRLVARWMQGDACSVYLLEDDDRGLVLRATRGLRRSAVGQVRLGIGEGLTGACVAAREPVAVPDVTLDERNIAFPESGEHRFRSMLAVPLIVGERVVGALTFQNARARVFENEEIELLQMIAAQVASIALNARLLAYASSPPVAAPEAGAPERPAPFAPSTLVRAIGVSPGLALGPVHLHIPPLDLDHMDYRPAPTPAGEWRAVLRALRETIRQVGDQREAVGVRFGEEFADVFTTHIMILEDQSFRSRLRQGVEESGDGARALTETMREYSRALASLPDATLRERALDIEDVVRRVIAELVGLRSRTATLRDGVIVVADRIAPSDFVLLETEKIAGLVTSHGGATSHAAIFARSLSIPAVSGVPELLERVRPKDDMIVDGLNGSLIVAPSEKQRNRFQGYSERYAASLERLEQLRELPSITQDGVDVGLGANIGGLYDLDHVEEHGARGVGLFRTEVLVLSARAIPDEEEQFQIYRRMAERLRPDPVTIRCFDLGGDKLAPGPEARESNPQLGLRSVRLLLDRPDILRAQLRAIVRANASGNLRILVPMLTTLDEFRAVRERVAEVAGELDAAEPPPLGAMIETPAAVGIARFLAREADFFSIGSNDLVQYTLGADRENERVADLYDPFHPAVWGQILQITEAAERAEIPCSICGELASHPLAVPLLVGCGLRELSMAPLSINAIRPIVRALHSEKAGALAREICGLALAEEVRQRVLETCREWGLMKDPELRLILESTEASRKR